MAKVVGIGGVFFKAKDPKSLGEWYAQWLGFEIESSFGGTVLPADRLPRGAYSVWGPFEEATDYFKPSENPYMINLIVDDLDGVLARLKEGGAEIVGEKEVSEFGAFGWFVDPEGNKVELWQPPEAAKPQ